MDDMQRQDATEDVTELEKLQLIEHWNNPVVVLMPKKGEYFIDGNLEVFVTMPALGERLKEVPKDVKMVYSKIPVVQAIDIVCKNECNGMLIRGITENEIYITREELLPLGYEAEMVMILSDIRSGRITGKRVMQVLAPRTFYMLGQIPSVLAKEEDFYSFDSLEVQGSPYPAVKLYLSEERAKKNNLRNFPIHAYSFAELAKRFQKKYALVIEPQQSFSVGFTPDKLS